MRKGEAPGAAGVTTWHQCPLKFRDYESIFQFFLDVMQIHCTKP